MANKTYTVVKNGEELETMKTLTAAKKLADSEGAEVYVDGKCVYTAKMEEAGGSVDAPETKEVVKQETAEKASEETTEEKVAETPESLVITAEPIVAGKPRQPEVKEPKTERYRLKALMNVRRKPSKEAQVLSTKSAGTVVRVLGIEEDWMHLAEGAFILYEGGRWAEKV